MGCSCCEDNNFPPEPEGITVEDEGIALPGVYDTLNFTGAGIVATDAGGGQANVTVIGGNRQVFRYTADGAEANPFTVDNATGFVTRANVNYNVQITMGGPAANAIKDIRALVSTFAVNSFQIELGAPLELNDVIMFTVEDLT